MHARQNNNEACQQRDIEMINDSKILPPFFSFVWPENIVVSPMMKYDPKIIFNILIPIMLLIFQ